MSDTLMVELTRIISVFLFLSIYVLHGECFEIAASRYILDLSSARTRSLRPSFVADSLPTSFPPSWAHVRVHSPFSQRVCNRVARIRLVSIRFKICISHSVENRQTRSLEVLPSPRSADQDHPQSLGGQNSSRTNL